MHRTRTLISSLALVLVLGGAPLAALADPSPTDEAPVTVTSPPEAAVHDAIVRDEPSTVETDRAEATPDEAGVALDAHAPEDDASHEDVAPRRRRAFRWSDGPRRVPTPRGISMERASELGLGTRECASRLMQGAPDEPWTRPSRGHTPERLLWPIDEGRWVRGFGFVRTTRPDLIHRGVDISAPVGTTVRAVADGIVAYSDNGIRGYGNLVMIVHRNGWMTLYAHNARTTVQPGYRVRRGERIAIVGTTGITHGPHVHFELWQNGRAVDPSTLFDGGPAYVERLGLRAARRGDVPAPRPVTDADRPEEAPLTPHPDERRAAREESARTERSRRAARSTRSRRGD